MTSDEPLGLTPSQTAGPFLHLGLLWGNGPYVVPDGTAGAFWVRGRVFDGAGEPVPDALVETWQADPAGRFAHPDDPRGVAEPTVDGFRGFGRAATDADGWFGVHTVRPGPLDVGGEPEAPHLDVSVLARGLLDRLVTRIYFPDEPYANAVDPVLQSVDERRRPTLVAVPEDPGLRFDIHLQGEHETVFFTV